MGWRRGVTTVVVALLLLFVVRTVWFSSGGNGEVTPVSINVAKPFYAVYFGSPDAAMLVPEFREGLGTIEERLASLIEGPRLPGLAAVMPDGVVLLGYSQWDDMLQLNFSHHLVTNHPGGSTGEVITVYGIVNTVVGAGGVRRVQILVDGRPILTLAGHLDLTDPLEKDYELLGGSHI
jgi:spore germination protein GerM